ncbi:hypothetical protein KY329_01665 [Candidatus Woesearchaeota archaeon]|nr:hypothetical protein [Candidatus Woesearchaeota archaeon]
MKEVLHRIIGALGIIFIALGIFLAVSKWPFYTVFVVGLWFFFDYIDYLLRGSSIIDFFLRHHSLFFLLLIINSFFAFLVDYLYGVRVTGMWAWPSYGLLHWLAMYGIMTLAFCLAMYEFFHVILFLLHPARSHKKKIGWAFPLGVVFLLSPLLSLVLGYGPYFMLLAFVGIWFVTDSLSVHFGGKSVLGSIVELNWAVILALLITVVVSFAAHEFLNTFSYEWVYADLPGMRLLGIPIVVVLGWVPLVAFCISAVYLVQAMKNKL